MLPDPTGEIEAILGPTCVGKTSMSLDRAALTGAEILSLDSRQIYREISIGTAKPTDDELARIPHHFISERTLSDPVSAAEFASAAHLRIDEILARGKRVLIVGGSTLYIHALLFGLDDVPRTDPAVREELSTRMEAEGGLEMLQAELRRVDPLTAAKIDIRNPRRVLRALEVYHSAGRPISDFQKHGLSAGSRKITDTGRSTIGQSVFVLDRARDDLYARINDRVDTMYRTGLVEEAKGIISGGFSPTLQALQTIGYKETFQHLGGALSYDRMIELVKRNTRRYAKRQLTWLRRYDGFEWVTLKDHS